MQDNVTTSWHRLSDKANNADESRRTRSASKRGASARQLRLQVWESEGGKTARCTDAVRILIVDSDVGAADSLELMLQWRRMA